MEEKNLEKAAYILKTIAHPVRLAIIDELRNNNQAAVSDICKSLNIEQSIISHHLINMKLRGLLKSTKSGQQVFYSLKERNLVQVIQCVNNCNCNM
jgi:ArsR family transcriptional regulator